MTGSAVLLLLATALWVWPARNLAAGLREASVRTMSLSLPEHGGRWIPGLSAICAAVVALFVPWHAALCAGALAAVAAWSWAQARQRRLKARQLAGDVEALQAVAAELQAGNDLTAALHSAGTTADTPMCAALLRAAHATQMGDDPAASLQRTELADVEQLAGLVGLSGSRGVALAEAVEALAGDAAERADARRDIASLLAGPRATAALLTLLPIFGLMMGQAIGADPWRVLLHTSAGAIAMIVGTALAVAGVLWTAAMVGTAEQ